MTYKAKLKIKDDTNDTILNPNPNDIDKILNNTIIESHHHPLLLPYITSLTSLIYQVESENNLNPQKIIRSNRGGHHSYNNITMYPPIKKMFKELSPYLESYANKLGVNYDNMVIQSWFIINKSGHYNISHRHSDAIFSGCYYITMDDERNNIDTNGALYFMSKHYQKNTYDVGQTISFIEYPGTDIRNDGIIKKYNKEQNSYDIEILNDKVFNNIPYEAIRQHDIQRTEKTQTGNLFLFPGNQYHQVQPYYSDKDRIVIAFNLYYCDGQNIYFVSKTEPKWNLGYNIYNNDIAHNLKTIDLKN